MTHPAYVRHLYSVPASSAGRPDKRRRVLITLPGDGCAAVAEDLGLTGRRFMSLLFADGDVAERRYCADPDLAVRHARTMLDEHTRLRAVV